MKLRYIIVYSIFLIITLNIHPVNAQCNASINNNIINIGNCSNITDVSNAINNENIIKYIGNNEWLLNIGLINNEINNIFYINETDVTWLKLNSTDTSCAYYGSIGKTEINNTKITSWNITSNNVEVEPTRNTCRSYIYAKDINSKINISNSNLSYLGYLLYELYFGTTWYKSNNNYIYNNTFIGNYRGVVINTASNNIVFDNYFENIPYQTGTNTEFVGVYIYRALSKNNIIYNNTIIINNQPTTLNEVNMGLFVWGGLYNNFYNNTILSDSEGYGIYLKSSANNNTFINININFIGSKSGSTRGIYIYNSKNNMFYNGSINTTVDDYLLQLSDSSNIFKSLNFINNTIYFYDSSSYFRYIHNNNDNIEVITTPDKRTHLKRIIYNWSIDRATWSDKSSILTATLNYTVNNLYNNTIYNVYINNNLEYELTTDIYGNLPTFNTLVDSTKIIDIITTKR